MTLQDELQTAKDNLANSEAALKVADLAFEAAQSDQHTAAERAVADRAEVTRIQALIDAQTPGGTLVGMWCQSGGALKQFERLQSLLGFFVLGFRSSGGEGQLDNRFVLQDSIDAFKAGHVPSLQFQPKTGSGSNRTGVPYADITSGKHDSTILKGFAEYRAFPPNAKIPFEAHSEFNIQGSGAQPPVGPASDYAPFVLKLDALLKEAGVRDRVTLICSAAGPAWWAGKEPAKWLPDSLLKSGAVDCLAIDFYAKVKNGLNAPDASTKAIREFARKNGLPWAVMETGCNELPGHPFAKGEWYGQWPTLMEKEGHDCLYVFQNVTLAPYSVESSPASLAAFKRMMADPCWRRK